MSQPYVLVVDDEPDIRELVQEILEDEGYEVAVAENGETARNAFSQRLPDLVLLDIWMPDIDGITLLREWSSGGEPECPVVVMSGHGNLETAVEATRLGAHDFVQKPISLAKLLSIASQAIESGKRQQKTRPATRRVAHEPIGSSPVMQVLRGKAEQAAEHDLPVLITGEKGSGRENLARHIHVESGRGGELVCLEYGELAADDCRRYLFGAFGQARGGTLFLPDIEELPREALRLLLPVLESGQYPGDADGNALSLDCRIIASACRQLPERAARDESLEALYYRLNVLPLEMPPLRERPDDVPELVRFYAEWFPSAENLPYRPFSVAAQNKLRNHSWPGNVRELRNLVRQLLVLGGEGEVSSKEVEEALKQSVVDAPSAAGHPSYFGLPLREAREQFEREYLEFKLREAGGSVGKLAETVEMERTHLYRKLRALGIDARAAARKRK